MAMTKEEQAAKRFIWEQLRKDGYPRYAQILDQYFEIHLTDDPGVIGYMEPMKFSITVNRGLNPDQVGFIVRHEILHEFLQHEQRYRKYLEEEAKKNGAVVDSHDAANMAMDWEMSDRGYSQRDKKTAQRIVLGDKIHRGLVLESDHPEWVGKPMEEIYAELTKDLNRNLNKIKNDIQIGAMGDAEIQKAEGIARQAQAAKEKAEDEKNDKNSGQGQGSGDKKDQEKKEGDQDGPGSTGQQAQDLIDKIQDILDPLKEKEKEIKGGPGGGIKNPGVFDPKELQDEKLEAAAKLKKIFEDPEMKEGILADINKVRVKENTEIARKEAQKYREGQRAQFENSLNLILTAQTMRSRGKTYSRYNSTYYGTDIDFILPANSLRAKNNVPEVNVYFDRTGSWNDEAKTAKARQAMRVLYDFEEKKKIKVHLYYFQQQGLGGVEGYIHSEEPAYAGGGTWGAPILQHILDTGPTNVIVLTDGDIQADECKSVGKVLVPGAVWFVMYGTDYCGLMDYLHGEQATEVYRGDMMW